jgi:hypothetical protein
LERILYAFHSYLLYLHENRSTERRPIWSKRNTHQRFWKKWSKIRLGEATQFRIFRRRLKNTFCPLDDSFMDNDRCLDKVWRKSTGMRWKKEF